MENIKRKIKLFFVTYGELLFTIIAIISIVIFVIQSLNNYVKEKDSIDNIVTEQKDAEKKNKYIKEDKDQIEKFIEYCKSQQLEEAYNMLSEDCKKEKYPTSEIFKNDYINKIFSIAITKYIIKKQESNYKIIFTQDALITGSNESKIEEIYNLKGVLDKKIYILQ